MIQENFYEATSFTPVRGKHDFTAIRFTNNRLSVFDALHLAMVNFAGMRCKTLHIETTTNKKQALDAKTLLELCKSAKRDFGYEHIVLINSGFDFEPDRSHPNYATMVKLHREVKRQPRKSRVQLAVYENVAPAIVWFEEEMDVDAFCEGKCLSL